MHQIIIRHNARGGVARAVMHAEIMAIEEANQHENGWRLLDTTLFVTIEPCVMCSGSNRFSAHSPCCLTEQQIRSLEQRQPYDSLTDERLNHRVEGQVFSKKSALKSCRIFQKSLPKVKIWYYSWSNSFAWSGSGRNPVSYDVSCVSSFSMCTLVNKAKGTQMNSGTLTQFEQRENYVPKLNESSLQGADES